MIWVPQRGCGNPSKMWKTFSTFICALVNIDDVDPEQARDKQLIKVEPRNEDRIQNSMFKKVDLVRVGQRQCRNVCILPV